MNQEEKYIARKLFQNKVFSSNGQAFEDLFILIKRSFDTDFRPIKPHGREGDRKNDGFNELKGQYYQVYSPENI